MLEIERTAWSGTAAEHHDPFAKPRTAGIGAPTHSGGFATWVCPVGARDETRAAADEL
jgi:hypothetical protein